METKFFIMIGFIVLLLLIIVFLNRITNKKNLSKSKNEDSSVNTTNCEAKDTSQSQPTINLFGSNLSDNGYRNMILAMVAYILTSNDKKIDMKRMAHLEINTEIKDETINKILNDLNKFPLFECVYNEDEESFCVDIDATKEKYNKYVDSTDMMKLAYFFVI